MDDISEVFKHWQIIMNHPKSRMDAARQKVIRSRLADGYSLEDLLLAIEGAACSPFHQGDNDRNTVYDSITLILRDSDHVDRFMAIGEQCRLLIEKMQSRKEQVLVPAENHVPPTQEQIVRVRQMLKSTGIRLQ